MAELSEADKRVLLGPDFMEKERRAEAERAARGGKLTLEEQLGRLGRWRAMAGVVAIVALLLAVSHAFRGSNYDPKLAIGSAIVAILALAVATTLHLSARKLGQGGA